MVLYHIEGEGEVSAFWRGDICRLGNRSRV